MNKTYISSLLVVLVATQTIRAQESLDDVFAQLDAAQGGTEQAAPVSTGTAPAATVETAQPAAVTAAPTAAPAAASKDLFTRALDAYQAGDLGMAEALFEEVLKQDPYDRRAMEYLKRTAQKISANEIALQRATRQQAMAEADASWNPDVKIPKLDIDAGSDQVIDERAMQVAAMTARLEKIVIPSLDFREANIKDVVLFLTETARRQDATKQGVNILLMGMENSMAMDANNITISIRDMSLLEALQYIVEMASLKFDVQPKAVAIMPVNYVAPEDLKLVTYDVIPEVGAELESMSGGGGGGVDDLFGDTSVSESTGPTDVAAFFSIVEWPEGSSAVYQPNFHKLFVKNTPKNLGAVEEILADLEDEAIKKRSQQVEIEAKFVEYNEGALEELGFSWTLYDDGSFAGLSFADSSSQDFYQPGQGLASSTTLPDGNVLYSSPTTGYTQISDVAGTGTGQSLFGSNQRSNGSVFETIQSGILSTMGGAPAEMILRNSSSFPFDLAITAMEQEGTADTLNAPKVTTKSGNEAIIRVVEVHRYPQDYDVETGQRTAPVVKPQDWEDYDLGVVLKVTPVVDAESNTIDLDLQPEITEFKGYDSYIAGYNAYESGGSNSSEVFGNSAPLEILMPYFETRAIQTQVTIADGATVVMGGLVNERTETFRDQVPFLGDIPYLGRLFRTEGSRSQKMNLVISVKATQVDDRGMTRAERDRVREAQASVN
ncbi:type II secretion system protein GspD [Pontiella sp.]|uniref:type II secretion system protein GspD n=1 Tax=Pontiella sp. TaxID=2837462 RepID=UPI0035680237